MHIATTLDSVPLHDNPDFSSERLDDLEQGKVYPIRHEHSGWYRVITDSYRGWVHSTDVEQVWIAEAVHDGTDDSYSIDELALTFPEQGGEAPAADVVDEGTQDHGGDIEVSLPELGGASEHDVAVIIGNREYSVDGVPDVDFALRDAQLIKKLLVESKGFDPANVIYFENATSAQLRQVFGDSNDHKGMLYNYTRGDDARVFVYLNGHGVPDVQSGEQYFVPTDADPDYISFNGYKLEDLYSNLSELPAGQVDVVIDACFSGFSQEGEIMDEMSPALLRVEEPDLVDERIRVVAAGESDQVASWYSDEGHGLFTWYFVQGITGEADLSGDGKISFAELDDYLTEEVSYMARRLFGRQQTPQIRVKDQDEIFVDMLSD
nr:caspase family protein [Halorhodospira halochloris]